MTLGKRSEGAALALAAERRSPEQTPLWPALGAVPPFRSRGSSLPTSLARGGLSCLGDQGGGIRAARAISPTPKCPHDEADHQAMAAMMMIRISPKNERILASIPSSFPGSVATL